MNADEAVKAMRTNERRETFYMSAVPPHPSRISRHLHGVANGVSTSSHLVLDRFHYDRCPTKPIRNKSPTRSRGDEKEREKVRRFLMEVSDRKARLSGNDDPQNSPSRSMQFPSESPTTVVGRYFNENTTDLADGSPASRQAPAIMIQIAPGVQVPLRDKGEARAAVHEDFYLPALCLGCSATLFVVQDAAFVLCPSCRTVSPMEGDFVDRISAGVGLGFTYEELTVWQTEILNQQEQNS